MRGQPGVPAEIVEIRVRSRSASGGQTETTRRRRSAPVTSPARSSPKRPPWAPGRRPPPNASHAAPARSPGSRRTTARKPVERAGRVSRTVGSPRRAERRPRFPQRRFGNGLVRSRQAAAPCSAIRSAQRNSSCFQYRARLGPPQRVPARESDSFARPHPSERVDHGVRRDVARGPFVWRETDLGRPRNRSFESRKVRRGA